MSEDYPSPRELEEDIDHLHDRIQFLEKELTESERTVMALEAENREKGGRRDSEKRQRIADEIKSAQEDALEAWSDVLSDEPVV